MEYFEFYDLTPCFVSDVAVIKKAWLEKNRQYHPDRFGRATDIEQEQALSFATLNNKAYSALRTELGRIQYILEQYGLIGESVQVPPLDPEFLMEMLEVNDTLDQLSFDIDAEKVKAVKAEISQFSTNIREKVSDSLINWHPDHPDSEKMLQDVRNYFLKNKYLLRILENVSNFASL